MRGILRAVHRAIRAPFTIRKINLVQPPWGDLRVRKALQYAIDRESLCRDVLNNICTPATGQFSKVQKSYGNPSVAKYHKHQ